ncbi:hypothetical protein CDAR_68651 [Caerostris darwini]|uniref:Uncharacterized protein n=1 Tax=Caerostris darwini TaxID=1538125 RepID=A0AAV4R9T2_9ARAC|nr:hypothetical protein CDAR_68651 [Caerostris darwini]
MEPSSNKSPAVESSSSESQSNDSITIQPTSSESPSNDSPAMQSSSSDSPAMQSSSSDSPAMQSSSSDSPAMQSSSSDSPAMQSSSSDSPAMQSSSSDSPAMQSSSSDSPAMQSSSSESRGIEYITRQHSDTEYRIDSPDMGSPNLVHPQTKHIIWDLLTAMNEFYKNEYIEHDMYSLLPSNCPRCEWIKSSSVRDYLQLLSVHIHKCCFIVFERRFRRSSFLPLRWPEDYCRKLIEHIRELTPSKDTWSTFMFLCAVLCEFGLYYSIKYFANTPAVEACLVEVFEKHYSRMFENEDTWNCLNQECHRKYYKLSFETIPDTMKEEYVHRLFSSIEEIKSFLVALNSFEFDTEETEAAEEPPSSPKRILEENKSLRLFFNKLVQDIFESEMDNLTDTPVSTDEERHCRAISKATFLFCNRYRNHFHVVIETCFPLLPKQYDDIRQEYIKNCMFLHFSSVYRSYGVVQYFDMVMLLAYSVELRKYIDENISDISVSVKEELADFLTFYLWKPFKHSCDIQMKRMEVFCNSIVKGANMVFCTLVQLSKEHLPQSGSHQSEEFKEAFNFLQKVGELANPSVSLTNRDIDSIVNEMRARRPLHTTIWNAVQSHIEEYTSTFSLSDSWNIERHMRFDCKEDRNRLSILKNSTRQFSWWLRKPFRANIFITDQPENLKSDKEFQLYMVNRVLQLIEKASPFEFLVAFTFVTEALIHCQKLEAMPDVHFGNLVKVCCEALLYIWHQIFNEVGEDWLDIEFAGYCRGIAMKRDIFVSLPDASDEHFDIKERELSDDLLTILRLVPQKYKRNIDRNA